MSKDGGPAFPVLINGINSEMPGMTLRDYFAAKALIAVTGAFISPQVLAEATADQLSLLIRKMPGTAYEMADAMLEARK